MMNDNSLISTNTKREEEILQLMTDVILYPSVVETEVGIANYTKLPISRITSLGVAFEPLTSAFQKVISGQGATSGIYKVTVPSGMHLAKFKNGTGNLGTCLSASEQIAGQATLNPLICDPTMIFMAATLANIDKKLDVIQETQEEILNFLVQKEKSKMRGDLNFLSDILNNYKHNWNNALYKNSNHIKVLDIRQSAERKIDFYREQITFKVNKKSFIYTDQDVTKQLIKMQDEFKNYQLALYLFAYSSFLEVVLLENYNAEYLTGIVDKIEKYSLEYKLLYTKCYDQVEKHSKTSVQSTILKGLASASKGVGDVVEKIPKISKLHIDETLILAGNKLGEINSNKTNKAMMKFIESKSSYVRPFIENINIINQLYNNSIELLFDKENVYISN